ncbi:MAG: hypothetical protein IJW16_02140 [Clostridia bacterium]|nr:hypothetical protein [Clostridia bacterium]
MRRVLALVLGAVAASVFLLGFMMLALNVTSTFFVGAERNTTIGAVVGLVSCVLSMIGVCCAIRVWFKS